MRLFGLMLSICLVGNYSLQGQDQTAEASKNSQALAKPIDILAPFRDAAAKRWEKSMVEFDTQNAAEPDPADAILFIGSSSIRRWESMATDMSPYRTIRRGYGGAKFTDMAIFVDRVIQPHQYRALVMFVGNGVVGKPEDHSPELIEALARKIVAASHSHQPKAPVLLIEITPCEKRYDAWPKIRAVNSRLREVALSTPDTYFIPTAGHYLRPDGTPRSELFVEDRLHLNEAGYQLWATLIRKRLNDVFRLMATTKISPLEVPEPVPVESEN
jgi:lysophospholipase L1-like esterase